MTNDQELVRSFTEALAALKLLVSYINGQVTELARMDERQRNQHEDVSRLYKLVYDGNGKPSLITQIAELKESVETLEGQYQEVMEAFDERQESIKEAVAGVKQSIQDIQRDERDMQKLRIQNRVAIIIAVVGLIGGVIAAFVGRG